MVDVYINAYNEKGERIGRVKLNGDTGVQQFIKDTVPTVEQKGVRKCAHCRKDISGKHVNAKFCSNKGFGNCKDAHHNQVNPRGYGDNAGDGYDDPADDEYWLNKE